MADIFISYKREDNVIAKMVAENLSHYGWSVWWDRNIPVGRAYDKVIEEELAAAKCIVVLWTVDSVQSMNVKEEASEGLGRQILIPISIGKVLPPYGFKMIQCLQWKNPGAIDQQAINDLISQISRLFKPEIETEQDADIKELQPDLKREDITPKKVEQLNPGVDKTACLRLTRLHKYSGSALPMTIYIDDVLVGNIQNGETLNFTVTAGRHLVEVKGALILKSGRQLIDIKESETQQWIFELTLWNTINVKPGSSM